MANPLCSDLSRRENIENELRKSEHRYRIMFENNPLAVIRLDQEGVILDCNDKFLLLMGAARGNVIGFNVARDSIPQMRRVITKALAGEVAVYEDEYTSVTGGRTFFLRAVFNPVTPGQFPTDIIGTLEDVSARKQGEEAIRITNERMKAIFSSINDPILAHPYIQTGHGLFSEVNDIACTRYGYTREEFLQLSVKDIIKIEPGQKEQAEERLERILDLGHLVFETVHITKAGEEFPVEVSASVMDLAGQKYILAVVRDISERYLAQQEKDRLESQLQQAQKMESVGRLAGGIAHDFNNMLSVILGFSDLALLEVTSEHSLYDYLVEIKKAAKHSASLTHQLLAFARKQNITPKVIDLNEVISNMIGMLHRLMREEIVLIWRPAPGGWPIKMDPSQIRQILVNLIINGRDAIAGNGQIEISIENVVLGEEDCADIMDSRPGEYVLLSVRDDGEGIQKEKLDYIFEPFFTTKGQGTGTGLGLATVYGIMKQNDGFISVTSEPGQGTAFHNYLPRYGGNEAVQPAAKGSLSLPTEGAQKTVLLVEDEEVILAVTKKMLLRQGYNVLSAASPVDAIRIAQECMQTVDVLLTDVIMPEMNGRELAKRILKMYPDIQCVYMSGYTADVIAHHGVLEDGVHFIQKPFSYEDMTMALNRICNRE